MTNGMGKLKNGTLTVLVLGCVIAILILEKGCKFYSNKIKTEQVQPPVIMEFPAGDSRVRINNGDKLILIEISVIKKD